MSEATNPGLLTLADARTVTAMFKPHGGFSDIEIKQVGFVSTGHEVLLWNVNPRSGNRNCFVVRAVPADEKEVLAIRKKAKAIAKANDQVSFNRAGAEREVNRE